MPTDVRYLVETDEQHTLLRLVGVLDPPAAPVVRGELLGRLADRPTPVAIDLSDLRATEPGLWALFDEVAEEVAEWPTGRPLLLRRDAVVPAGGTRSPTPDEALARLGADLPPTRLLSLDLAPVVGAARAAREMINDGCARWDLRRLSESACIAMTEMVNNVVAHARTRMTVRLAWRDRALRLAVRDYSTRHPNLRGPASPTAPGGRGLLLIDTVVRRWGSSALADGKVVWAVLHPEDEPAI
nr:ATP-binding protein [Micromonospora sp. DSM 115978]